MKKSTLLFIMLVAITGSLLANDFVKGNLIIQTSDVLEVLETEPELITNKGWFNDLVPEYQISGLVHIGEGVLPEDKLDEFLFYKVVFDTTFTVVDLQQEFDMENEVIFSGSNFLLELYGINTNDFYADDMWGLEKIGMNEVWDPVIGQYGDPDVIVAVIDTGVDLGLYNYPTPHEDLGVNLWQDINGYYGWNPYAISFPIFGEDENIPQDLYGHGTHVSGTIGAMTNNGIGVAGVVGGWNGAPGCKIMTLRVGCRWNHHGISTDVVVQALCYAYTNTADVINMSFGGNIDDYFLHYIIEVLYMDGCNFGWSPIMIASAGNDDLEEPHYPAAYPEVISVAATDENDRKCMWSYGKGSNYGDWIDICAPGGFNINYPGTTGIYSTTPMDDEFYYHVHNNVPSEYASGSGTSMACPHVAGVAALIKSHSPDLTNQEIRGRLLGSVEEIYQVNAEYLGKLGSGRLDAHKALIEPAHPHLTYVDLTINDENNGIFECGEVAFLEIDLKNWWIEAVNVTGTLETEDVNITISYSGPDAWWENIGQEEIKSNINNIQIYDNTITPRSVDFTLHLESDNMEPKDVYFSIDVRPNTGTPFVDLQLGENHFINTEIKIADIDNDDDDELIVGTTENRIYIIDYPNQPIYVDVGTTFNCTPAIGDINNDGYKEIVVGNDDGQILVYDRNLNLLHTYYVDGEVSQAIILEDVNGDGQLDIVASSKKYDQGHPGIEGFYIINPQTHQIFTYDLGYRIKKPISVADVDNENNKDIVIVCQGISTGIYLKVFEVGDVFFISETFSTLLGDGHFGYAPLSSPVIANIDEEGLPEILYSYTCGDELEGGWSGIVVYNIDNPIPIWGYGNYSSPSTISEIVVCDLDENSLGLEVIYTNCTRIGVIYYSQIIFDSNGNIINTSPYHTNNKSKTIVSDIDCNGENEIIKCSEYSFRIYDNQCNELEEWEAVTGEFKEFVGLGIAEIENNEDHNIVLIKKDGTFYKFSISSSSNSVFEWSQFKNNSRNTGCYYQPLPEEIDENITLKHDTVIDKNIKILPGNTLTIEEGTEIRFGKFKSLNFTGSQMHISGGLICIGTEADSIRFGGLCSNETNNYWNGITFNNNRTSEIEHSVIQNSCTGLVYNDVGRHKLNSNRISNNHVGLRFYNSPIPNIIKWNSINNNYTGVLCHNNAAPLFAPDGINSFYNNQTGMYVYNSNPSLQTGHNNLYDNSLYNMTLRRLDWQVMARQNWWGGVGYDYITGTLDPADFVVFIPWDTEINIVPERSDTLTVFQEACILLSNFDYILATDLFKEVIEDSLETIEDPISIACLFTCYKELGDIELFGLYIDERLTFSPSTELQEFFLHYKAMVNRALENPNDAIIHYEDIILNNPSYADSCYAVIDIGNTYLEANGRAFGRLMYLQPESFEAHYKTTQLLLESIRTGNHIQNNAPQLHKCVLHNNYPNPFNPETTISFTIPKESKVDLSIYNIKGQRVCTLAHGKFEKGYHQIIWNSKDDKGKSTASGIYFYKLKVNGKDKSVKKCLLLK